jgi:hypothetical protein
MDTKGFVRFLQRYWESWAEFLSFPFEKLKALRDKHRLNQFTAAK